MHNTQQQLLQLCGAPPSPRRAHSNAVQPDGLAAHAAHRAAVATAAKSFPKSIFFCLPTRLYEQ